MTNKKEQWIDDVIRSAKKIGPVESNPYLATRIEAKLQQKFVPQISIRWVYATVAAMTIILFVNITVWKTVEDHQKTDVAVKQLVKEYGWTNQDLYSNNSN